MTASEGSPTPEFDAFRVAVGFGVLSGAAALVLPFLDSLTLALAAIALAAWVWRRSPRPLGGRHRPGLSAAVGWACAATGFGVFWGLPAPLSSIRGLLLGLSLVPLWWLDRGGPSNPPAGGTDPG